MIKLYGFEDYTLYYGYDIMLVHTVLEDYMLNINSSTAKEYWLPSDLKDIKHDICVTEADFSNIAQDHKELLETAKNIYIHPSCSVSRSLLSTKYKKVLEPWIADVVVIPSETKARINRKMIVFINEKEKELYTMTLYSPQDDEIKRLESLPPGTSIRDIVFDKSPSKAVLEKPIMHSELLYVGDIISFDEKNKHLMELYTNALPSDRTVYEESIVSSLSSAETEITLEALLSIRDMFLSSDDATCGAALKALSVMDWVHYPNCIKYILSDGNYYWRYNKACNSVSVKYMLNSISNIKKRAYWPGRYSESIYECDYNLLKELKMHCEGIDQDTILKYLNGLDFMTINAEGRLIPNIKERA